MIQELQQFGLTEKEAQVYLASLELGRATADQIAKRANVKRPTTYVQIESLQEKGLISSFEEGKKTYFAPESPENLNRLLERQKKELELTQDELLKKLPDLRRMFESAGERPLVRYYEGKEGITTMRENALTELRSGETLNVLYSYDSLFKLYEKEEVFDFSKRREEKGIHLRLLYTKANGKLDLASRGANSDRRFIEPAKLGLKTDFFIYKDTVALMALEGRVFGIEIQSLAIRESLLNLFDLVWTIAESE